MRDFFTGSRIKLVQWHLSAYPAMHSIDMVKMVYQAVFGNHHIQAGRDEILNAMKAELKLVPESGELLRMTDPLGPDCGWIRIHLRPFIQGGGDPESLVQSIQKSASISPGIPAEALHFLHVAQNEMDAHPLSLPGLDLTEWAIRIRESGFEPVHHSPEYRKSYHPAYRVVHASTLEESALRWITPTMENI